MHEPLSYRHVIVHLSNPVALLKVNRPHQLNALNMDTLMELSQAVKRCDETADIRAVILTGEGEKSFVAGADIPAMREMNADAANAFSLQGHRLMDTIETSRKPFIAAVQGYALGGGTELALACDLILAAPEALFGLPETTLGLFPGFGGTQRLPRLIGPNKARELIFTGEKISAEKALALGIVNRIVPKKELMHEAQKLALTIAANSPTAVALAKRSVHDGMGRPWAEALENERRLFAQLFATSDCKEGLSAFLEKRTPNFQGT